MQLADCSLNSISLPVCENICERLTSKAKDDKIRKKNKNISIKISALTSMGEGTVGRIGEPYSATI